MSYDPREKKLCSECEKYIDNRNWSRHVSTHSKTRPSRSISASDRTLSVVGSDAVSDLSNLANTGSGHQLSLADLLIAEKAAADLIQQHSAYDLSSLSNFLASNFTQVPEFARPYLIIGAVAGAKHVAHVHYMAEAYKSSSSGEHAETYRKIQRSMASWSMGLRDSTRPTCSSPTTSTVPMAEQTQPESVPPPLHSFLVELGLAPDSGSIVLNKDMEDAYVESLGQPPPMSSSLQLSQPPQITRQTPTSVPNITSSQPFQLNRLMTPTPTLSMVSQPSTPVTMISQSASTTQNYPINQQRSTHIIPVHSQLSTQNSLITPLMTTIQTHPANQQIETQAPNPAEPQHRHQPSRHEPTQHYERYRPSRRRSRSPSYEDDRRRYNSARYPYRR